MRLVPLTLKTPESRLPRTLILRFSPSIQPSSLSLSLSLSSAPYAANVLTQGTSDGFKKVPGPLYVPVAPSAYSRRFISFPLDGGKQADVYSTK
jgi:hypothetical protein